MVLFIPLSSKTLNLYLQNKKRMEEDKLYCCHIFKSFLDDLDQLIQSHEEKMSQTADINDN